MAGGSIEINVLANTQKLVSGLKKAEGVVAKSARNMTRAMYAFGAIFVSGKLTSAIGRSATEIDKLGKTASKLGIGTRELGSLQYAAEQSGIKVETLNMALQRSTRRISEAANGYGSASKALKELGLEASELNALSPDEQLNEIADAMENVTNQSDKVRLSFALFDSAGVDLVRMIGNGSDALKEYALEASSLGILMDEKMVRGVEAANDAQNRFSKSMSVAGKIINVQLAPYIIHASNVLVELIKRFSNTANAGVIFGDVIAGVARGFIIGFNAMQVVIDGFMTSWQGMMLALEIGKETFGFSSDVTGAIQAFREQADLTKVSFDNLALSIDGTDQMTLNLLKSIKEIEASFVTTSVGGSEAFNTLNKELDTTKNKLSDTDKAAKSVSNTFASGMTSAFREALDGASNFGDIFENVAKDIVAQLIHILVVQQAVNAAMGAMGFGGSMSGGTVATGISGGLASGGTLRNGGTYVVGERGPEILNLPAGANVTPNGSTSNATAPSITINNYGNDAVTTKSDDAGNIEIIIATISNQITRGTGTLGTALESRYNLSKS